MLKRRIGLIGVMLIMAALLAVGVVAANSTTSIVSPDNMKGWVFAEESGDNTLGSFVPGPDTAPAGLGSAQFELDDSADGLILALPGGYPGTRLDELTAVSYSTYQQSAPGEQAATLQIHIDYDVTDGDHSWQGRLVFEPYYDSVVNQGEWQHWDALAGRWWATGAPGNAYFPQSSPASIPDILAQFPNAGIKAEYGDGSTDGTILLKAGSGWSSFVGNADELTVGVNDQTTIYDFEPGDGKGLCKSGAWEGNFDNPGACVSHFASDGTSTNNRK